MTSLPFENGDLSASVPHIMPSAPCDATLWRHLASTDYVQREGPLDEKECSAKRRQEHCAVPCRGDRLPAGGHLVALDFRGFVVDLAGSHVPQRRIAR